MKFHRLFTIIALLVILFYAAVPLEKVSAVVQYVKVGVEKTAAESEVPQGTPVSFTITVRSYGGLKANNVILRDTLPAGSGLNWVIEPAMDLCQIDAGELVCNFGSIPSGKSRTVTIASPTGEGSCGLISNTAVVEASDEPETELGDNSSTAEIMVTCPTEPPVLAVEKTADAGQVDVNEAIGFTITASNTGGGPANDVVIEDQLDPALSWVVTSGEGCSISDSQLLTCAIDSLAAGAEFSVHVSATSTTEVCGRVTNTASAYADGLDPVSSDEVVTTVVCPGQPALAVEKTADAIQVASGEAVGFTIAVTNTGSGPASNVVVEDQLNPALSWSVTEDAGCSISAGQLLTCEIDSLAAGIGFSAHVSATSTTEVCGYLTNTASAYAADLDPVFSDEASTIVVCPGQPVLVIEKTADAEQVASGEVIGFAITVANTGSGPASNVVIEDQLDPALSWAVTDGAGCDIDGGQLMSCEIDSMAAGAGFTVHVSATSTPEVCGQVTNTASVYADGLDPVSSDEVETVVICPGEFNVMVTKLAEEDTVELNDLIQFTMTVTNFGPAQAPDVTLTDTLPVAAGLDWSIAGLPLEECTIVDGVLTCDFGAMDAGASRTVSVSSTAGDGSCGTVSNTASVTALGEPAGLLFDNTSTDSVLVACPVGVNVSITKTAEQIGINQGQPVTFTMEVANDSLTAAEGVTLSDPLPTVTGVSWTIVAPVPEGCQISENILTCEFGTLEPGDTRAVTITSPTETLEEIVNTATVSATNETEGNQFDNQATARVNVLAWACITMAPFTNGLYANNFEVAQPGPAGIENYKHSITPNKQQFMGEYGNETASLNIGCLPDHTYLLISFDLYLIRSWDGNTTPVGPDHWKMELRGQDRPLIDSTFSNYSWQKQSFPGTYPVNDYPAFSRAKETFVLGYRFGPYLRDSVYTITMYVKHTGEMATFDFTGYALQSLDDESWGIDNLTVTPYSQVYRMYAPLYQVDVDE